MLPLLNMDEALDIKPTVTVEGKQLELLKLENAQVGQEYQLSSPVKITSVFQDKGDETNNIPPITRVTFELTQMVVTSPEKETDLSGMFPNSP